MRVSISRCLCFAVAVVSAVCSVAFAQPQAQQPLDLRIGDKTTEPRVVAYVEGKSRLGELQATMPQIFKQLYDNAKAANLAVIPQAIFQMDLPASPDENTIVAWEAQIPVGNKAPEEKFADQGSFKLKAVDSDQVAYSFHIGFQGIEETIVSLIGWMGQHGQTPGPKITFLTNNPMPAAGEQSMIELQIGVQK